MTARNCKMANTGSARTCKMDGARALAICGGWNGLAVGGARAARAVSVRRRGIPKRDGVYASRQLNPARL